MNKQEQTHLVNPLAWGRQRQADPGEFEASPVYIGNSRSARSTQWDPVSKKLKKYKRSIFPGQTVLLSPPSACLSAVEQCGCQPDPQSANKGRELSKFAWDTVISARS